MHLQCLKDKGYSEDEYKRMQSNTDKQSGPNGNNQNECVVCMDAPADHCVLFCMHVCLCQDCAKQ
jgi:hypothetical protein